MKPKHYPLAYKKPFLITASVVLFAGLVLVNGCHKFDHHNPSHKEKVDLKLIADGLVSPLGVVEAPDNSGRLFVIDQIGKVWIIDANGNKLTAPFIDLTGRMVTLMPDFDERGLLGLAFHPNYKDNGRFFIYYQRPPLNGGPEAGVPWDNLSRVAEFKVSASDPNVADAASEKVVLEWNDPQFNHNGGTIAFGPDGFLYIAVGDGGEADDVAPGHVEDWYAVNAGGNGQDVASNLLGSILRIDVNASPYAAPADNPFVNKVGYDAIYAYGFRNPYRISFDMGGSHDLYAGDAGQVLYEEIDVVVKGGNYGWNVKEGFHCFNAANNDTLLPSCPDVDNLGNRLIDPVIEVVNAANPMGGGKMLTIIGGNVYRGNSIPGFHGKYIFGSFGQTFTTPDGELFIATPAGPGPWKFDEIELKSFPNDLGHYLKGFGQDSEGEIYVTVSKLLGPSGTTGKVYKLVRAKGKDKTND
ncbi:MAG TPA: PQQ-dependent sugar dehydrogenase [Chitinophagaceae bacterium]|nr:PQQ-dependent sugar dehydrogenase [Chitinophagaceae bacterium]